MRFIPNGPSIPDELLIARDAGEVLFFCGAGVSQASANLPNFTVLAKKVLDLLGSALDSPARRLFDAGREFESATGLNGLIATDRIFGMLEREFEPTEVREAVAIVLKPDRDHGLEAHRILLDLSRNRAGISRLVTTNFDLLFEECELGIDSSNPPHLPDPRRDIDFRGIIHLHGRVDPDYRRACDDEFVLSSADFGRAYLSEGWATRYIQALLRRYHIVFVGYSADDPPVQYLLEALNRFEKQGHKLYAFQSGDTGQAIAQWSHKGVEPIAYDSANGHAALWNTLSAWAERSRDVDSWHDRLILNAGRGPAGMAPHERGMIAHLASTTSGSYRLLATNNPLPADWLCVFDRNARYGQVSKVDDYEQPDMRFDPFEAFGLDTDEPPSPTDPDNRFADRVVPENAWDGITAYPSDRAALSLDSTAQLSGARADGAATLPPRLSYLGTWIAKVAHQPAALWWAAKQNKLHPNIQRPIEWSLRSDSARFTEAVSTGWRLLFASWRQKALEQNFGLYNIEARVKVEGWSSTLIREAIELYQPQLTVKAAYGVKAPEIGPELSLENILKVDVEYPRPHKTLQIPADMLRYAVTLFRQKLEYAVQLEHEIPGNNSIYFDTTRPDDGETLDEDGYRLTGHLVIFTNMLRDLSVFDLKAAREEVIRWSGMEDPLFTRLRIWASGRKGLTTPEEAGQIFLDLDDETFWTSRQERDLLFSMRDRWSEIPPATITRIESRLCDGEIGWAAEHVGESKLIAHHRLNRICWLSAQGVNFSFDYDAQVKLLRSVATEWTERSVAYTARPNVSKVRTMDIDMSATSVEQLPLSEVLDVAQALGQFDFNSHIERQPFHGLVAIRPARALSVITDATRKGRFFPWAWAALLSSSSEAATSLRHLSIIGHRLARLPVEKMSEILHPVSEWLSAHGEQLLSESAEVFDLVWEAIVSASIAVPTVKQNARPDRSWADEGLNSPIGRMLEALFKDPATTEFQPTTGLPQTWKRRLEQLLDLKGDFRQHAIAMISPQLNWLFHTDQIWTQNKLLPLINNTGVDRDAFWAGYLWNVRPPQRLLFLQLKPSLIELSGQTGLHRDKGTQLARLLLSGWGDFENDPNADRLISDIELREILIHANDDFRSHILWHLEHWILEQESLWKDHLTTFLTKVWPKQRDVRTPQISGRLVDIALAIPDLFSEVVEIILPRLEPTSTSLRLSYISEKESTTTTIAERYPEAFLKLLWASLGPDPINWPYGVDKFITILAETPCIQNDVKVLELRKRIKG